MAAFSMVTMATESYRPRVARLRESAQSFGHALNVVEVASVHRSISPKGAVDSPNLKAAIIEAELRRTGRPVLWLDADMVIAGEVSLFDRLLEKGVELAVYNWLSDPRNAALRAVGFRDFTGRVSSSDRYFEHSHEIAMTSRSQLICSGAVQLWTATERALQLLDDWKALALQHPRCQDDHLLDAAFNHSASKPKLHGLPKSHCRYAFWPHVRPVIDHPDFPYGGNDWDDTQRAMGKPRVKVAETQPRAPRPVAAAGMVFDRKECVVRPKDLALRSPTIPVRAKDWD